MGKDLVIKDKEYDGITTKKKRKQEVEDNIGEGNRYRNL